MRKIRGEGPVPCVSAWVGLGPGLDEERKGRVWVGPAGHLLDSLLYRENIDRREIFISNLRRTMIQRGDGGPLKEIAHLELELARAEPSILVTMGREATQWVLGDVDLEAVHGIPWRIPPERWEKIVGAGRPPVLVPMYNPAYALHEAEAFTMVSWDVHQVRRVLDGKVAPREVRDEYPQPDYSVGFVPYKADTVYIDTEGFPDRPWCLSYACVPGRAHVILARDSSGIMEFGKWLWSRRRVVLHSAMWDLAVLRAMGIHIREDQLNDTKVMVYVNGQIDPPGLKALGFRYACMKMREYGEVTGPYEFVQAMEYLEKVSEGDWGKPDPVLTKGEDGKPKIKQPQGLNTRLKSIFTAVAKGPKPAEGEEADPEETEYTLPRKRWLKIEPELRAPAEAIHGPMPEFSLDLVPLDEAVAYAGADADATCRIEGPLWDQVVDGDNESVYWLDIGALPIVERMQSNGMLVQPGYFENLAGYFQKEMDKIRKKIEVYNNGRYINPGSSKQTAALLFGRLRLPILKVTKLRQPSTADKVLEALRGRHDAVGLICDWRENATLKDKFCNKLPLYICPDGRVRGTIRDTTVVSGRYSMSNPNLTAIPVRTHTGKKIREGFVAGEGNDLSDADYDQVEMRVMADLSDDASMISAFIEGRDIHSENASMMFGVKLSEVNTPEGKLNYRYPAKRIGFGIITGITELGLYDQMRLAGITRYSVNDCADMIQSYFRVRPGIKRFIDATRASAIRDGYVRDKYGRIRYLPGVYSKNPGVREEALRQSHSHTISGTAQGIKKRGLARIWDCIKDLPRGEVEPLVEIHDEIVIENKKARTPWVARMLVSCMSKESPKFKVPITAKCTSGPNWGVLKD